MPASQNKVLVLLQDGTSPRSVFRGDPPADLRVRFGRWGRFQESRHSSGELTAVLYEIGGGREALTKRIGQLRRLAPGAPLLAFRRGRTPVTARAGPPALHAPIDAALLREILDGALQIGELRQRLRRTAAQGRAHEVKLQAFTAIVRATGNELDPRRVIDLAMAQASRFLKIRAWLFLLADPEQGTLTVEQVGGEAMAPMKGTRIGLGDGIAGRCGQRRQPVLVEDVGLDGSTYGAPELPQKLSARSVLAVPLLSRGRLIGVVEVVGNDSAAPFRSEEARLLSLLMEPAAVAVDNGMLLRRSEELSITDDLTKLYNSRFLNATLHREVERSKRYRTPVSLIFLDLDGFKNVNDQHGHLFGSRTLVEVGAVIKSTVREIDVVSRFGGDEFTVILPQTGPEGAQIIADRIRQRIDETLFLATYGVEVRLTASIGIACFPDHGRSKDDLIARADQAMYSVKGRGKNGVALAETDAPRPVEVRTVR